MIVTFSGPVSASTRLKNICRIKGQEENVLRGYGLVVGLNGTGEANDAITMQAIARSMEIMGNPLVMDGGLNELRKIKNAAVVMVTATVPATGARRGDRIDCFVSGLSGKSLAGGRLAFASLQGPNTLDKRVYALCQGQVTIDDPDQPMVGVVHGGCQMEADIFTPFVRDGHITFVLDKNHANFQTSDEIAKLIYEQMANYGATDSTPIEDMVRAIDAANIIVRIPETWTKDPVGFASDILDTRIAEPEPEARVTINPRAGTIVISGEVEIGDVIVSHKNVVVEAESVSQTFSPIDVDDSNRPKLDQLVTQLNSLKVPTSDVIEIIRGIERNGKLHGRLIIE
ncbi:MAG: flagellar basal body P-ring protein FlgI [Planctomycetes bacterium]|nr:flagellar basal body P-ring protein FlgI [Planctomycetota bacterium]